MPSTSCWPVRMFVCSHYVCMYVVITYVCMLPYICIHTCQRICGLPVNLCTYVFVCLRMWHGQAVASIVPSVRHLLHTPLHTCMHAWWCYKFLESLWRAHATPIHTWVHTQTYTYIYTYLLFQEIWHVFFRSWCEKEASSEGRCAASLCIVVCTVFRSVIPGQWYI